MSSHAQHQAYDWQHTSPEIITSSCSLLVTVYTGIVDSFFMISGLAIPRSPITGPKGICLVHKLACNRHMKVTDTDVHCNSLADGRNLVRSKCAEAAAPVEPRDRHCSPTLPTHPR